MTNELPGVLGYVLDCIPLGIGYQLVVADFLLSFCTLTIQDRLDERHDTFSVWPGRKQNLLSQRRLPLAVRQMANYIHNFFQP
ncbi:hypothetical protein D3C84_408470 [compost metagenome]